MTITLAELEKGLSPAEYVAQMSKNKDAFEENLAAAPVSADDIARFRARAEPLEVLVITEDWCGDSLAHLPVLFRLARETERLRIHVFKRDEDRARANRWVGSTGNLSIPTIVFYDRAMTEQGRFVERPGLAASEIKAFMADFFARHPEHGTAGTPVGDLRPEAREALFAEAEPWRKQQWERWNRAALAEWAAAARLP